MRTQVILWVLCTGIVFSPIVKIGVYLRYDQLFFLALIIIALSKILLKGCISTVIYNTLKPWILFILAYITLGLVSSFLGSLNLYNILNFPLKVMLSVLMAGVILFFCGIDKDLSQSFNEKMFIVASIAALIGILQFLEHTGTIPFSIIRNITSELFPYRGILTDAELTKTGGYYLKMGGAGRITGTFDGQPILFGDFLATILVVSLHKVQKPSTAVAWLVLLLALILTQSRGSWLGAIVGIGWYLTALLRTQLSKRRRILSPSLTRKKGFAVVVGLLLLFSIIVYVSPIHTVVATRIESTLSTLSGAGLEEARFSDRWPSAIQYLLDKGLPGLLLGSAGLYDKATDSMYLWLLVNIGLLGTFVFLAFHILLFHHLSQPNDNNSPWSKGWRAAIVGNMVTYIFHPTWQGDRWLTYFVVGVILTTTSTVRAKYLLEKTKKTKIVYGDVLRHAK